MKRIVILAVLASIIPPFIFGQTGPSAVVSTKARATTPKNEQNTYPGKTWQKAKSPEAVGWSPERLKQVRQLAGSFDTVAAMIVQDGIVVDEWGETDKKFNVHSIRKSFLSALYGLAV